MTETAELNCPKCKHRFGYLDWHDAGSGSCRNCRTDFKVYRLPALTRDRAVAQPRAISIAEDSTCFFHAQNQAEKICDGCGRFVCSVCAIPNGNEINCPSCVAQRITRTDDGVTERTLYASLALSLAVLPLLIYFLSIITAPIALGLVFYGWNRPGSLIKGRQRWKMIVAGVIALLELAAWCFVLVKIWLR